MNLYWTSWIDDANTEYNEEFCAKHGIANIKGKVVDEDLPPCNENIIAVWCSGANSNADWAIQHADDPVLFSDRNDYIARHGYCMVAIVLAESKEDVKQQIKNEYSHVNTLGHIRFINRLPYSTKEELLKTHSVESDSRFRFCDWHKERVDKAYEKISEDMTKSMLKVNWETLRHLVPKFNHWEWKGPNDCDIYLVVKLDSVIELGRPLNAGIHSDSTILVEALGDEVYIQAVDANHEELACIKKDGKYCLNEGTLELPNEDWITLRVLPFEEASEKLNDEGREVVKELLNII